MNEKWVIHLKKWGSLAVAFLVIVCISGALPRYLTPPAVQPQPQTKKANTETHVPAEQKIAHLALVNEDQGASIGGQKLNLGNQVAPLFSDQDDYGWETVSRSSADSGLKNGDYQAAIYIPSDFTSNIFTYNHAKPKTAIVSYRANPKLTAEESAKIQTEFQKVKGTLNQKFSQVYWRVVSDQLSYIRNNFSDVLNKDKQYLQAMSDFYKPSSKNMAQLFDAQLTQVNELLTQTKQTAGEVNAQQATLTDTKKQVSQQLDALNQLNDQMRKQIAALQKTRDTNKQLVDDAIHQSQDHLNDLITAFNKGMENPMHTEVAIDDPLNTGNELTGLNNLIDGANTNLSQINTTSNNQFKRLAEDFTDTPMPSTEALIKEMNASKNNFSALINPSHTSHSDNVFGQVTALNESAKELYGKGLTLQSQVQDLNDQGHQLYEKGQSLYEQLNDLHHQSGTLYDQGQTLSDQVQSLYKNANELFEAGTTLDGQVTDMYNQATTLFNQAKELQQSRKAVFDQGQTFYEEARTQLVNRAESDLQKLAAANKPIPVETGEQWEGEQSGLSDIKGTQEKIAGTVTHTNLAKITALTQYIGRLDQADDYENPSLFIDATGGVNYDKAALLVYQALLNNTNESLKGLLDFVEKTPNKPAVPADPMLKEPSKPETVKRSQPGQPEALTLDPPAQITDPELNDLEKQDPIDLEQPIDPSNQIETTLRNVTNWIDRSNGQLTSSTASLGAIRASAQTVDQHQTLSDTKKSIQDKYSSAVKQYSDALENQKSELGKVENSLTNNMNHAQQQVASIAKPLAVTEPDPTFEDVDNGFALSFKSSTFDQLTSINEALQSISDNQSSILKASKDVQSTVNSVQGDANQLTGSWSQNINATAQLGSTIARTLGNAGEPGNRNPHVYQQLTSPVALAGQQIGAAQTNPSNANTEPEAAADETAPVQQPFLTLLAVLVASILTGFFSYHYRNLSLTANALISVLLAAVTSAAVIYYGIVQYGLDSAAAIMWSMFTLGLIAVMSAWVREAYQLSELVGMLIVTAMIVFFTLPLLRNSLDRFAFQNPVSDVYMAIIYGPDYLPFYKGLIAIVGLFVPVLVVVGIRAIMKRVREEKAHETESM
ncbi:type VII secretion protein EsaA [Sporolactobacillus terrae]|uniref:ESX secretion system protein YueB n=1 Tax=Sporolactobacillus terrae TaxID=269673 RepID=A0A5K7X286_9BACL|nr:type VII secretion protein EsaA [Sporolactobacillus terrae]BBO00160.1 ESX secretion system protein YueB [Sporolactobacillus terrae]